MYITEIKKRFSFQKFNETQKYKQTYTYESKRKKICPFW